MARLATKVCLGSCLALATASAAILTVQYLKKHANVKLPPMADISPWDVVRELTSPTIPLFQLEKGLQLDSPVYRLPLPFGKSMYVVMDPTTTNTVLKDDDLKSPVFINMLDTIFDGPSLVTIPTTSVRWQKTRRALSHMFAPTALLQKVPLLHEHAEHLITILDEHCRTKQEVDIVPLLLRFVLDFVGLVACEYRLQSLEDPLNSDGAQIMQELDLALREFALRQLVNPLRRFMFWNPEVRRANASIKRLASISLKMLNYYRQTHSEEEIQSSPSIIAEILRNPHYPDDAARASEVSFFLTAGHDTTSSSIAWTLYDVARHPAIAAELQEELDSAMAADSHLSATQLSQLKILDACIKESMRLWPALGPGIFRYTTKPTHYKDMVIPPNSEVMVPFYGTGRWPQNIDAADEYQPHRWLGSQEEVNALEERFVVFAKGRRNCVGQNLVKLEMRLVLARLLHRFEFKVAQEPIYHHMGITRPLNLKFHVRRRSSTNSGEC